MGKIPYEFFLCDDAEKLPETKEPHYLVGKNGVHMYKDTPLFRGVVKVDEIPFLQNVASWLEWKLPAIPELTTASIVRFFQEVTLKHHTEAVVLLYFSIATKRYRVWCPKQEVSIAAIHHYDSPINLDAQGYRLVGSIHSHNTMSAFHSGIDCRDEMHFDGLHITIGDLKHKDHFDISATLAVNNNRFTIEPDLVVRNIVQVADSEMPKYKRAKLRKNFYLTYAKGLVGVSSGAYWDDKPISEDDLVLPGYKVQTSKLFTLLLPNERKIETVEFPVGWMKCVKVYTPPPLPTYPFYQGETVGHERGVYGLTSYEKNTVPLDRFNTSLSVAPSHDLLSENKTETLGKKNVEES